jgi:hypothetical protein
MIMIKNQYKRTEKVFCRCLFLLFAQFSVFACSISNERICSDLVGMPLYVGMSASSVQENPIFHYDNSIKANVANFDDSSLFHQIAVYSSFGKVKKIVMVRHLINGQYVDEVGNTTEGMIEKSIGKPDKIGEDPLEVVNGNSKDYLWHRGTIYYRLTVLPKDVFENSTKKPSWNMTIMRFEISIGL